MENAPTSTLLMVDPSRKDRWILIAIHGGTSSVPAICAACKPRGISLLLSIGLSRSPEHFILSDMRFGHPRIHRLRTYSFERREMRWTLNVESFQRVSRAISVELHRAG